MTINPLQAVYPNLSYIASADTFFDTVKEQYTAFKSDGFFNKTAQEGLFIYRIHKNGRVYTGIIGSATIEDYKNGNIKRHENTISAKEQQQMNLLLRRSAMVKPVLLTYPPVKSINQFIEKFIEKKKVYFEVAFEEEESVHQIWAITTGQDIQKLQNLFKKNISHTYIADGHHRTSTSALMSDRPSPEGKSYDPLLCAFFTTDNLEVWDFNRIIEHIDGYTPASFIVKLTAYFEIKMLKNARKPKVKHEITMQMGEEWFSLKWHKNLLKKHKKETAVLDVSLLNQYILKEVLGIQNVRTDMRIKYVEGAKGVKGMKSKISKHKGAVGFMMYPVDINDIIAVADANESLPPKSTWFEPRMKNGLLVLEF